MKRKTKVLVITIITILIAIIGVTYAYFTVSLTGNDEATSVIVTTGSLGLVYTNGQEIVADKILPGWSESKPFTVENTGTRALTYYIYFDNVINTFETKSDLVYEIKDEEDTVIKGETEVPKRDAIILSEISIDAGEIHSYILTVTFKNREENQQENMGKIFTSRIQVVVEKPDFPSLLYELILAQGTDAQTIINKGKPVMSTVPTAATSGLYAAEDEYGMSYYYRGEKDSLANNVIFAEHQWKIVRINGDGSIRLIYNGKCLNNSCTINNTGTATAINNGTKYVWNTTSINDAKYVGYMYGGANGVASTSLNEAQTNETNSNAKTIIDGWYEANIKNTKYEQYIADSIFCNDRSITSGTGYGKTGTTLYKVFDRLDTNRDNPTPTLKCEKKNDRFTVNDTMLGNGSLNYPIGLISADEVQYAGTGKSVHNTSQYLYTGQYYWSFSPYVYNGSTAIVWGVSSVSYSVNMAVTDPSAFRVVINLLADILVSEGSGTASNPYIIKTE